MLNAGKEKGHVETAAMLSQAERRLIQGKYRGDRT